MEVSLHARNREEVSVHRVQEASEGPSDVHVMEGGPVHILPVEVQSRITQPTNAKILDLSVYGCISFDNQIEQTISFRVVYCVAPIVVGRRLVTIP